MVEPLDKILTHNGYSATQPFIVRKEIRVKEMGTVYVLQFKPEMLTSAYQVDGYIIKNDNVDKCDYVILANHKENWAEIFVELKGCNISHGVKQLRETITNQLFKTTKHSLRRARIVTSNRIPTNSGNSIVERAKVDFKKLGCDFKVIRTLQPEVLSNI